jgi:hypothetical protein
MNKLFLTTFAWKWGCPPCTARCLNRSLRWTNLLWHTSQEKGRSPHCTLRCAYKLERWENLFLHTSHEKCLSSLRNVRCLFRSDRWENLFLHTLHTNGRSPMWALVWVSRLKRLVKLFLHTSHLPILQLLCASEWTMWHALHNETAFLCACERMLAYMSRRNQISLRCVSPIILHSVHQEAPRL